MNQSCNFDVLLDVESLEPYITTLFHRVFVVINRCNFYDAHTDRHLDIQTWGLYDQPSPAGRVQKSGSAFSFNRRLWPLTRPFFCPLTRFFWPLSKSILKAKTKNAKKVFCIFCHQKTYLLENILRNKTKIERNNGTAISAKLWMSWESTRKVLENFWNILVLVAFQFWWHFSLGVFFALVTLLLSTVYCLPCTVGTFLNVIGRFLTIWDGLGQFVTLIVFLCFVFVFVLFLTF